MGKLYVRFLDFLGEWVATALMFLIVAVFGIYAISFDGSFIWIILGGVALAVFFAYSEERAFLYPHNLEAHDYERRLNYIFWQVYFWAMIYLFFTSVDNRDPRWLVDNGKSILGVAYWSFIGNAAFYWIGSRIIRRFILRLAWKADYRDRIPRMNNVPQIESDYFIWSFDEDARSLAAQRIAQLRRENPSPASKQTIATPQEPHVFIHQHNTYHFHGEQPRQEPPKAKPAPALTTEARALEILGLKKPFTQSELKKKRNQMLQKTHPDQGGSDALVRLINESYETLKK